MRRLLAAVPAALLLAACAEAPLAPTSVPGATAPRRSSDASPTVRTVSEFCSLCNDQTFTLTGHDTYVSHVTYPAAGGFKIEMHENFAGQAVSSAGERYTINGFFNYTGNVAMGSTDTQVQRISVIGRGGVPDERFTFLVHTTFNANGEPTAVKYDLAMACPAS